MSLQTFFNSRFSVQSSIFLSRNLPPSVGSWIGTLTANLLTAFKNSELIQTISTNQWVAQGEQLDQQAVYQKTRSVIKHAAQCYYDLYHHYHDQEMVKKIVPFSDSMESFLSYCRGERGMLVVSPHMSNFDLVVQRLLIAGLKARVLSHGNPTGGYEIQNRIRKRMGMDLVPLETNQLAPEIIDHLKAGGVAATGVDRPLPDRKRRHWINFFGRPSPLPVGHISLALAADVPIIVVSAIQLQDGRYGFLHSGPLELRRDDNKKEEILQNAEMILQKVAEFIRRAPEQWLMFYPVWPDLKETPPW
jgi:KDO2-lipid IV(A) lauroyltransferase